MKLNDPDVGVDERVVDHRGEGVFFEQDRMIVIEEDVSYDGNLGAVPLSGLRASRGNGVRGGGPRGVATEVHEDVALDMGVGPVQVEPVVAAAEEHVIEHLKDGPGPIGSQEIDDVVAAGAESEDIAIEDQILVALDILAVNHFAAADAGKGRMAHQ